MYAQWKLTNYTVKFEANGGTGTMDNQTFKHNDNYKLRKNAYTREGYEFIGWKDPTGKGIWNDQYSGVWRYENGQYGITNDTLVLKAQWRAVDSDPDDLAEGFVKVEVNETGQDFGKKHGFKNYTIKNKNNASKSATVKFATGDKFEANNKEYTIVVLGDVDGDGKVNVVDLLSAYSKINNTFNSSDIAYVASDVDENSKINLIDLNIMYYTVINGRYDK